MLKDKVKKVKEKVIEKKDQAVNYVKEHSGPIIIYGSVAGLALVTSALNRRMRRKELRRFYDKALEGGAEFHCKNTPVNQVIHMNGDTITDISED